MKKDQMGDRFKGYEAAFKVTLPKRLPLIIRLDGRVFHTFTKDMQRPFDESLSSAMAATAANLVDSIDGARFAYTQSDEISILVVNYNKLNTNAWFDNELQKIVSVSAGIASAQLSLFYDKAVAFDARAFIVPEAEVANYFVWRQKDAIRNSVQMVAQSLYSHKQLHGMNQERLKALIEIKGQEWDAYPIHNQRGICVYKLNGTQIDFEPPVFTENRNYIERFLATEE